MVSYPRTEKAEKHLTLLAVLAIIQIKDVPGV
jgi:hypothetical protein